MTNFHREKRDELRYDIGEFDRGGRDWQSRGDVCVTETVLRLLDDLDAAEGKWNRAEYEKDVAKQDRNKAEEQRDRSDEACAALRAEVARLKEGGCTRDQRTTQFCAEAVELRRKLDAAEAANARLRELAEKELAEKIVLRGKLEAAEARIKPNRYQPIRAYHVETFRAYVKTGKLPASCDLQELEDEIVAELDRLRCENELLPPESRTVSREDLSKVRGLCAARLEHDNPREVKFAAAWAKENEWHPGVSQALAFLASAVPNEARPVNERDAIIAATVIQWLGSNCGMAFLQTVLGDGVFEEVYRSRKPRRELEKENERLKSAEADAIGFAWEVLAYRGHSDDDGQIYDDCASGSAKDAAAYLAARGLLEHVGGRIWRQVAKPAEGK